MQRKELLPSGTVSAFPLVGLGFLVRSSPLVVSCGFLLAVTVTLFIRHDNTSFAGSVCGRRGIYTNRRDQMTPEKEKKAIERLKLFEPEDGYYLAYSGGKDSDCIKILAQLAGVKFEAHHNLTTVDAPETVYYVKSQPDVIIDKALDADGNQVTMWNLILKKLMPPTRIARYCCSELKERGGKHRVVITGVRWAESSNRKENAGTVKIIGKSKTTQKKAEEIGADYAVNKQGGLIMNDDNVLLCQENVQIKQTNSYQLTSER